MTVGVCGGPLAGEAEERAVRPVGGLAALRQPRGEIRKALVDVLARVHLPEFCPRFRANCRAQRKRKRRLGRRWQSRPCVGGPPLGLLASEHDAEGVRRFVNGPRRKHADSLQIGER
jgi:hypothetical protein